MYIRRKVFSILADEMGEERLYSVNETLFEDYEVEEQKEFSKKKEKEEKIEPKTDKLRFMDRVSVGIDKHLKPKTLREAEIAALEDRHGEAIIKSGKVFVPVGAVIGGTVGGIATKSVKGALKGVAAGAASGVGGAVSLGLGSVGNRISKKLSPTHETMSDRRLDEIKVANGEMTKKEFKKKYYNNKRIKRLDD